MRSSIYPTPRDYNKAHVLDVVLSHAPLTRNKLIELTGLSKATVSRAVEELRSDGFVVDGGVDAIVGRGRPSTYLDVPETAGHVVGVGFGAVTTGVLVTDLRGREIGHVIVPTVEHHDVPAMRPVAGRPDRTDQRLRTRATAPGRRGIARPCPRRRRGLSARRSDENILRQRPPPNRRTAPRCSSDLRQ